MINPKPFLLENHLTVPLILDMFHLDSFSLFTRFGWNDNQNTRPVCVWWRIVTARCERSSGIEATLCGATINPTKSIHETRVTRSRTGIDDVPVLPFLSSGMEAENAFRTRYLVRVPVLGVNHILCISLNETTLMLLTLIASVALLPSEKYAS
jgi:hypothetical protein